MCDGTISDGYHTMDELYEHRHTLYLALASRCLGTFPVWRSRKHSDGSSYEGWFILGIHKEHGCQITYHLPERLWDEAEFAETLENAPEWDGHNSDAVLVRLAKL